jgi:hypothetical protein
MSDTPNNKHSVGSIQLSAYTPHNYVDVKNKKGWIEYGVNNDYPDYLIDLFNESPTHHALCVSLSYWIFGAGLDSPELNKYDFNETLLRSCLEFKINGYFFLEIVWTGNQISRIEPMPSELMRCGERVGREIPFFWYCEDWSNTTKYKPRQIRAFSSNPTDIANHPNQILYIRPFSPGSFYYAKPDYIGAVEYCELEKRIGTFHNSAIKNGLAPSYIIKLKNGTPTIEEQAITERNIKQNLSGENNAGSALILYSSPGEEVAEVDTVQLSDADKQYQFLSGEAAEKIMIGHRVVSPMLFGLKNNTGLGSNADELVEAESIMRTRVLEPAREMILRGLNPLFKALGIQTTPEWKDKQDAEDAQVEQSFTGIQISSAIDIVGRVNEGLLTKEQGSILIEQMLGFDEQIARNIFATEPVNPLGQPPADPTQLSREPSDAELDAIGAALIDLGEDIDEAEWELVDAEEADKDEINFDGLFKFASVLSSNPNGQSEQDNDLFKVRYAYAPNQTSSNSRSFCVKMVGAGKVYRKEDIEAASDRVVNAGFGPRGANTYDIWLYKGGARCHHFWERRIYLRRNNKKITVSEAQDMILEMKPKDRNKYRLPVNNPKVAKHPNDMPNHGFLNPPQ